MRFGEENGKIKRQYKSKIYGKHKTLYTSNVIIQIMGSKKERRMGGGLHSPNQRAIKSGRDRRPAFSYMDGVVEGKLREERIKRSLEEFEEREKLVEEQRKSYEDGLSSESVEESRNAGLKVEPVKGGVPIETIEQLQEVKEGSQKDSSVKKPQLFPRRLRDFVREIRIKVEKKI